MPMTQQWLTSQRDSRELRSSSMGLLSWRPCLQKGKVRKGLGVWFWLSVPALSRSGFWSCCATGMSGPQQLDKQQWVRAEELGLELRLEEKRVLAPQGWRLQWIAPPSQVSTVGSHGCSTGGAGCGRPS